MRTTACYCSHYGKEWLFHSMRSVDPFVDEIRVYYTPEPSHGHRTTLQCPDTRDELRAITDGFGAVWHEGTYPYEGAHRDFAYQDCADHGAEAILVVDGDELWQPEELRLALLHVRNSRLVGQWRVNMLHFWRSLNWVCCDNMWPLRIIVPSGGMREGYIPTNICRPLHMGYAQSPDFVKYKISIHGHKAEFRKGWFEDKFLVWPPGKDVHPTCVDTWDPEPFDKESIYELVHDHPYYDVEPIGWR